MMTFGECFAECRALVPGSIKLEVGAWHHARTDEDPVEWKIWMATPGISYEAATPELLVQRVREWASGTQTTMTPDEVVL
jgi:hypothetical protein